MHCARCCLFTFWLQAIYAIYQIQQPELEFLSKNLRPIECIRFYKLLRPQTPGISEDLKPHQQNCKRLLNTWLNDPEQRNINKANENVESTLRRIGRSDLAHWLGYNIIHRRQLASGEPPALSKNEFGLKEMRRNLPVKYKGDDHLVRGSTHAKLVSNEENWNNASAQTVLQKIAITVVLVLSMTTLCLCCYKFLYGRMRGGHFANFRNESDEESWLQQDGCKRQCGGGSGSCCARSIEKRKSRWNFVENLKRGPFSAIEYLREKFQGQECYSREKRSRQFRLLTSRLQKTCPTQRKIIRLNRKEQKLLKSLTDAEKHQLPATDSDLKYLLASDRDKKKYLARENRREFLIELRKRLEMMDPGCKRNITLNETERKLVRKLSSSERLLLPIMDEDLELMVSSPFEKRQITLRQMACKLAKISHEDRKYLDLDKTDKKFIKEIDEDERKKLGVTESEFRFLVASESQKNVMLQRLESCDRNQRIKDIRKKLAAVKFDISRLELSKIEHSSFLSFSSCELARLGLTNEHVKFYAASDSERRVMWPSPSQQRSLSIDTLQTKLSKLPWKNCNTRLTFSEHNLLASLTPREQDKLHISDSEKNFMLSTDSEKELIQRQRKIEKLEGKIRDFNTVTMTESERGLILSLSSSEMQMLNIDSTNRSTFLERKSSNDVNREMRTKIEAIKDRIRHQGLHNVRLTNSERSLIESLRSGPEFHSCDLTPSQLSFLLATKESERRINPHSNSELYSDPMRNNQSNYSEFRHKVQFREPEANSTHFAQESTDDSGLSETYDELGMLFSQQIKQQARPCQRKYCLLGRHLKRGSQHDERQCQVRNHCCRGYPSDQRPSCSSGNVCRDTYDELQLMRARPNEKRQLNSSMFERRKQFLDQPCHKCSHSHDNCMRNN